MEFNATFLISAVSFIVFVFIMNAIFYQPIMKIMEERNAFIEGNAQDVVAANASADEISAKKEAELSQARAKAKKTVDEGTNKFKVENRSKIDEFMKNQQAKTASEKSAINDEAENSKDILNKNAEDLSKTISDKILGVTNV